MYNSIFPKIIDKLSKLMIKVHLPLKICRITNDFRHNYVKNKLNRYFISAHNKLINDKYYSNNSVNSKKNIWTFWWQGVENMPIIVKQCINSISKHSSNHEVNVITKNNFYKYIDIPDYILNKFKEGYISVPHFSDIIRFKLLEKYGGLWIDSTIYCNQCLKNNYFLDIYTSGGNDNKYHNYVSGKWSSFLIGGSKHNDIFIFMNNFYNIYWKNNKRIIDYFLIDYALNYIYEQNIGNFKSYVDKIAYKNNPHIHDLEELLNSEYNQKIYNNISSDTGLFKLTYKKELLNNKNTFYNMIVNK